jgi:hypothetical protein
MTNHWKDFSSSRKKFLLVIAYLMTQAFIYIYFGINTSNEANKYVREGEYFYLTGNFSAPKYLFYAPIILLVAACHVLTISAKWAVLGNLVLNAFSTALLYKLILVSSNAKKAFWGTLILITFIPLQIWNWTLYTDSIFISLSIIFIYWSYRQLNKKKPNWILVLSFLPLLIIARPHGLLFIPPTIITLWIIARKQIGSFKLSIITAGIVLVMLWLLNFTFSGGGDMNAMKPFVEEHIICFVPTQTGLGELQLLQEPNRPMLELAYYISHNPLHFLTLMVLKLVSFFNLTRTHYSFSHNLYLSAWMIIIYTCSFLALLKWRKINKTIVAITVPLIILYPLGATFQCDDWHSRFTMAIIPILAIWSSNSIIKEKCLSESA